jgi:hypothetical protein
MKLDGFGGYEPGSVVIVVLHVANVVMKLSVACPPDEEVRQKQPKPPRVKTVFVIQPFVDDLCSYLTRYNASGIFCAGAIDNKPAAFQGNVSLGVHCAAGGAVSCSW